MIRFIKSYDDSKTQYVYDKWDNIFFLRGK